MIDIQMQVSDMSAYRDEFGMITQADRDGGDTANRTGAYYVYLNFLERKLDDAGRPTAVGVNMDLTMLEKESGRYVRHPDPNRWYSNMNNFSRDQSIHLQSMMIMFGLKTSMIQLIKSRIKRLFFHFNTEEGDDRADTVKTKFPDPPAPIEFAQFIRGTNCWILYPLLWILDLQLLIDVGITRPITIKDGNKDFDSNYLPILIASTSKWPTLFGWLSKLIYKQTDAPKRIRLYFKEGPGLNGLTPLGELAVASFNKLGGIDE